MPRLARIVLNATGYAAAVLGLLPGLAYLWVYVRHTSWLLSIDWSSRFGFAGPSFYQGRNDFAVFWTAGMALRHQVTIDLYDCAQFGRFGYGWFHALLPPFMYPPATMPLFAALALLPLPAAYHLFNLASLVVSVLLLWRSAIPLRYIALGLISPAVTWNLCLGQFGLLCGSFFIFGLSRLDRQPGLGGFTLSLLALKPQYALLVPVAVLARRNWTAMAAGALGAAMLAALPLVFVHASPWASFLSQGRQTIHQELTAPFIYGAVRPNDGFGGTSVFWMLRSLHVDVGPAYAVQGAVSLLAIAAAWHVWRDDKLPQLNRLFLMALLALLASPYGYTNDLCIVSILLPTLARPGAAWRNAALAWLWSAPALIPVITEQLHILITPLLLAGALALAWRTPTAGWCTDRGLDIQRQAPSSAI
jgi:alpha-1,2-mannosyltransferase